MRLRLAVVERPAGKRCEASPEDHPGIGQIGIGNDTAGDQKLGTVDQRLGETGGKPRGRCFGCFLLALPSVQA